MILRAASTFLIALSLASAAEEATVLRDGIWRNHRITYLVRNGLAFYQRDILLDQVSEAGAVNDAGVPSNVLSSPDRRWTNGIVPFELDDKLSAENAAAIQEGIKILNALQVVTVQPRQGENNYIRFINDDGCYSFVGMVGGQQPISMGAGCESPGTAIHEILHALGGYHDQSRTDREKYVTIRYDNIDKVNASNFDVSADGQDVGFYDFSSLSHYGPRDFTRNGKTTIETLPSGIPIGQDSGQGLSPDDIQAVRFMYGKPAPGVVITSQPRGRTIVVDGNPVVTPATFNWDKGTQHTLAVQVPQLNAEGTIRLAAGRWSDDTDPNVSAGASRTIVVDKADAIFAYNFVQQFQILVGVTDAGGGSASITPDSPDGFYTSGAEISLKGEPSGSKFFLGWTGAGPFESVGQAANPFVFSVTRPVSLRANFGDTAPAIITSTPPGRVVTVDGTQAITPVPFIWEAGSKHTIGVDPAPQMQFDKILRHNFQSWSDGGDASHSITAAPGQTITANFTSQFKLVTQVEPPSGGKVDISPAAADGWYDQGVSVQITAIPSPGSQFVGFSGDLTGTNNSGSVVMNDQILIKATFSTSAAAPVSNRKR